MQIRSGYIPCDVIYTFGGSKKITKKWEHGIHSQEELEYITVTSALVADIDNDSGNKDNLHTIDMTCFVFDHSLGAARRTAIVQQVEMENKPLKGLRVVTVEPADGSMGYKVLTPEGYLVEICDDVLLDAMDKAGIDPGGVLRGEFLWGVIGSTNKLIRIDSELFKALLDAGERHMMSSVSKKFLKPGVVYENKVGDRGLFLGFVNTTAWTLLWPDKKGHYALNTIQTGRVPKLIEKNLRRHMLWFDLGLLVIGDTTKDPTPILFADAIASPRLDVRFKLRSSHKMIKEVGMCDIPSDVVEQVRQKAIFLYKLRLKEKEQQIKNFIENYKGNTGIFFEASPYGPWVVVANAAACCLMHTSENRSPLIDERFTHLSSFPGKEFHL